MMVRKRNINIRGSRIYIFSNPFFVFVSIPSINYGSLKLANILDGN